MTMRFNKLSVLVRHQTMLVLGVLVLVSIASLMLSTGLGDMKIAPKDLLRTILGRGSEDHTLVVKTLRLPRIITAMLVGASLAASGAILQGVIRNPLASPDIIGITGGATVAAVAFITFAPESVSIRWLPLVAMCGAAVISFVIYALAWKRGVTPIRLVLIGIGFASLLSALTTFMLILSPVTSATEAYIWLTGTVYGANWENVRTLAPWTLILLPLSFVYILHVNVQQLGDDIATSMGSSVQRNRFILLLISVGLAGSAVAVGGGIGFVGLIAPHIARRLVGASFGSLLPVAAFVGAVIVVLADLIARTVFMPLDVPVGVLTSGIGAPFFIYLLYRNRNARS